MNRTCESCGDDTADTYVAIVFAFKTVYWCEDCINTAGGGK